MRRFMIVLAIAATLAAGGVGRAEGELATCKGTAPSGRGCSISFTIAETMAVNLRLAPAVGYTGSLTARIVTASNQVTVATAGAYFAAGQATPLAHGVFPETTTMVSPGIYKLVVESAKVIAVCANSSCTPQQINRADTFAAGDFAAEVVPTDSVV